MNVLIVEDSRFLRVSNERALQHAGYNVITAADGEEGLRLALERKPDLVVLDLMLPKLPGYEVLRELRNHRETAEDSCNGRKQPASIERSETARRGCYVLF